MAATKRITSFREISPLGKATPTINQLLSGVFILGTM
jgi:hypothetical protein